MEQKELLEISRIIEKYKSSTTPESLEEELLSKVHLEIANKFKK